MEKRHNACFIIARGHPATLPGLTVHLCNHLHPTWLTWHIIIHPCSYLICTRWACTFFYLFFSRFLPNSDLFSLIFFFLNPLSHIVSRWTDRDPVRGGREGERGGWGSLPWIFPRLWPLLAYLPVGFNFTKGSLVDAQEYKNENTIKFF